jgi:hypothetical protein
MTAQSRAVDTAAPLMRWQAVAAIIRKDMHLLGPYALAGAIWTFAMSALFHTDEDFFALMASIGVSEWGLDSYLFALLGLGLPVALTLFVILLAQANVASDTRHDWLIRPVTPLELVASKVVAIFCVMVAPMIAGNFIYMMVKAAPLKEAFAFFLLILTCGVLVLVLSWLVSTPFRAVLALLGLFVLLTVAGALGVGVKVAIGTAVAGAGERPDLTPFPNLDGNWIVELVAGVGLYVVSGITLWLLLARRKPVAARWLFVGYFAISMFLQNFLFDPIDKTETAASAPEAAMTHQAAAFPPSSSARRPVIAAQAGQPGTLTEVRDNDAKFEA